MTEPTVLYGIGAQKAGSTWVYRYLLDHPECRLRAPKELHYWDSIDDEPARLARIGMNQEKLDKLNRRHKRRADELSPEKLDSLERKIAEVSAWLELARAVSGDSDEAYRAFLLRGVQPGHRVVADITPAYATVGAQRFARMNRLFAETRFLFILRDPAERAWSSAKMYSSRPGRTEGEEQGQIDIARQRFAQFVEAQKDGLAKRSDYVATLKALDDAVPAERLLVLFYEELFTPESVQRITDFLGIAPRPADFDTVVNAGPKSPLPDDLRLRAHGLLADQYEYVERRFGRLPARWSRETAGTSA